MSTIRPEAHTNLITRLINDIYYQRSNYYYFLGKIDQWDESETVQPAPSIAAINDIGIRDGILYLRKVVPADISLVATSYSWVTGTVFAQWDHTQVMIGQNFYCVTDTPGDEFNVYKCLNNNNGAASTVKPTGTGGYDPFTTADGYLWKYMYTIPTFKRKKFLSQGKMPIQKSLSDAFYTRGAIEQVVINDGGDGYTEVANTTLTLSAEGETTTAVLVPAINSVTGSIERVIIVDPGSGYPTAPTITVSGAGTGKYGSNPDAIINCEIVGGVIDTVWIEDPGVNYVENTTTTITAVGDGTGASFTPVVYDNGVTQQIIDVVINDQGQDYSYITLTVSGAGTGASLTGIISASDFVSDQSVVEQVAVPGAIYSIVVTEGGTGYTGTTTVTINGDGTGATATATVDAGVITEIVVTSYGSGYTYTEIVIDDINRASGTVVDAAAYCILPPMNGHGYDAVKELYADTVAIYSLIRDDVELNLIEQDYRQYGLLENPVDRVTFKKLNDNSYIVAAEVDISDASALSVDDIIINNANGHKYRIVTIDGNTLQVQGIGSVIVDLETSDEVYQEGFPSTTYTITGVTALASSPNKYSGNLMYIANRSPFIPASEQAVAVRTYVTL